MPNSINKFDCAIIGSGISGIAAAQVCRELNVGHIMISPITPAQPQTLDLSSNEKKLDTRNLTPKLSIKSFKQGLSAWRKRYPIRSTNFHLIQVLENHGLYKYWGCNLGHAGAYENRDELNKLLPVMKASDAQRLSKCDGKGITQIGKELKSSHLGFHIVGHDPLMAIDKQQATTRCPRSKSFGCNCDGTNTTLINYDSMIIDGYVISLAKNDSGEFEIKISSADDVQSTLKCSRIIFAAGPIASTNLASQLVEVPQFVPVIHNGLYSFPFFSLIASPETPFGLSNLNLSIINAKSNELESYANIFPLRNQLRAKFPWIQWLIPDLVLKRLYYCIVFTDSKFTDSVFDRSDNIITGRYKRPFKKHVWSTFTGIGKAMLFRLKAMPIMFPNILKPGSDIHYAGCFSSSVIPKNLRQQIFFADSSEVTSQPAMNPTALNLISMKRKLKKWLEPHNSLHEQ